jgi:hypothetical protein
VVGDDRDVDLARRQAPDKRRGQALGELELDVGVLVGERPDRQRDQGRIGRPERTEPQAAARQAGERLELRLGRRQPVEDRVGVLEQQLPGERQPDAARAAVDQLRPRLELERGDLARDGGLGERERRGGRRERAAASNLAQDHETADVEHAISV